MKPKACGTRAGFFKVQCPKCGAAVGRNCTGVVHAHLARVYLAERLGITAKTKTPVPEETEPKEDTTHK